MTIANSREDEILQELLEYDIRIPIPPAVVSEITSMAPFVTVPGVHNIRDIGSTPVTTKNTTTTATVRKRLAYRSGNLTGISDKGRETLTHTLKIAKIFDLRNASEREKQPSPIIEGIETVWIPPATAREPFDAKNFVGDDDGVSGYVKVYFDILEINSGGFRAVFKHIRDFPEAPFLFHCFGGKDRTGVLAALILCLAGTSHDAIVNDYALTRIGIEPVREMAGKMLERYGDDTSPEAIAWLAMCSVKPKGMKGFLEAMDDSFKDGVRGYVKEKLGFSDDDVKTICMNLKPVTITL